MNVEDYSCGIRRSRAMRFRLVELFAVVFVCGFACVALVRPSPEFASLFFAFTLCTLLAAILCAVARRGDARFFWIGFVIGGGAFLWWIRGPGVGDESLVTSRVVEWLFRRTHGEPPGPPSMGGGMFSVASESKVSGGGGIGAADPKAVANAYWEARDNFIVAGHCFFTLMLAWIAGHFCRFVRERAP